MKKLLVFFFLIIGSFCYAKKFFVGQWILGTKDILQPSAFLSSEKLLLTKVEPKQNGLFEVELTNFNGISQTQLKYYLKVGSVITLYTATDYPPKAILFKITEIEANSFSFEEAQ